MPKDEDQPEEVLRALSDTKDKFDELNKLLAERNTSMGVLIERLKSSNSSLEDVNSSFPATQEFLAQRGLLHVRELDRKGYADLIRFLTAKLD